MDCPRCESALDRYEFKGRVAYACDRCGYIGIPVEHTGNLRPVESWDDAIKRFNEKGRRRTGETAGEADEDTAGADEASDAETEEESPTDETEEESPTDETDGGTEPTPAIRRVPEPAIRRIDD